MKYEPELIVTYCIVFPDGFKVEGADYTEVMRQALEHQGKANDGCTGYPWISRSVSQNPSIVIGTTD